MEGLSPSPHVLSRPSFCVSGVQSESWGMTWAGEPSSLIATRICPLTDCYVQAAGMRSKGTYLLLFFLNLCVQLVCLGRRACHNAHVKVRGQLLQELVPFFHLVGSGGQPWVIRHGGKCPYSLSHLGSSSVFKNQTNSISPNAMYRGQSKRLPSIPEGSRPGGGHVGVQMGN